MGARLFALAMMVLLPMGCARKAPSSETCVAFTELLVGMTHEQLLQRHPEWKTEFDLLVVTCLTEPFDSRVFTCAAEMPTHIADTQAYAHRCLETYGPAELRQRVNGGVPRARRIPW
ncbi:MAG: hypothetical protein QM784_03435 [Polyangiaceae bacterium]